MYVYVHVHTHAHTHMHTHMHTHTQCYATLLVLLVGHYYGRTVLSLIKRCGFLDFIRLRSYDHIKWN